jgi:HEXXH motif-containing protein
MDAEPWDLLAPVASLADRQALPRLRDAGEPLTVALRDELAGRGLRLRRRDVRSEDALDRSENILRQVPSLHRVVLGNVRDLMILDVCDDAYDISHSEPRWPGLVLVSLPPTSPVGDMRLLEGIIHEAMHLHLSRLEAQRDLVFVGPACFRSPWREESRPASGVLHGTYVFGCVLRFFDLVVTAAATALSPKQREHAYARRAEIREQLASVPYGRIWPTLTEAGRAVVAAAVRDRGMLPRSYTEDLP